MMTIENMIRRLRAVRDDDRAVPLNTHEYAEIIGRLTCRTHLTATLNNGNPASIEVKNIVSIERRANLTMVDTVDEHNSHVRYYLTDTILELISGVKNV